MTKKEAEVATYGMSKKQLLAGETDWEGFMGPYKGPIGDAPGDSAGGDQFTNYQARPTQVYITANEKWGDERPAQIFNVEKVDFSQSTGNLYTPVEGFFQSRYRMAVQGINESANAKDVFVNTVLGAGVLIPALVEGVATGLYNAPNAFYRAGQATKRAIWAQNTEGRVDGGLEAVRDTADGTLGLLGPFAIGGLRPQTGMRSLGAQAASRVTYTSVGENIEGVLFRRQSNIGHPEIKIPMQLRYVMQAAQEGSIGLKGIKIKISRDPEHAGANFQYVGSTPADGKSITLFPKAFTDTRTLIRP